MFLLQLRFCACLRLFDLLLQGVEFRCGEKFAEGDAEAVAELFEGDDPGILAFTVQNTFDRCLRDSGIIADAIGGKQSCRIRAATACCVVIIT